MERICRETSKLYCAASHRSRRLLNLQRFEPRIKLERFRIAERFLVFHWPAMHNLTDSEFDYLAGFGARDICDLYDLGRHVAW